MFRAASDGGWAVDPGGEPCAGGPAVDQRRKGRRGTPLDPLARRSTALTDRAVPLPLRVGRLDRILDGRGDLGTVRRSGVRPGVRHEDEGPVIGAVDLHEGGVVAL
jgi:hypothetical protein